MHILWGLIFCIQKDIINEGLELLISLELLIFSFSLEKNTRKSILYIASTSTVILTLIISMSSLILVGISFKFPDLRALPLVSSKIFNGNRLNGIIGNANLTGAFSAIGIICSIANYSLKKTLSSSVLCYLSLFINGLTLILTASRTSILFCGIFFIVLIGFTLKNSKSIKKVYNELKSPINALLSIIITAMLLIIIYSLVKTQSLLSTIQELLMSFMSNVIRPQSITTGSGRTDLYQNMLSLLLENPLIGVGNEQIRSYGYLHSHNAFIQCLVHSGLFCGILFIFLWIYSLISSIKLCLKNKTEQMYPILAGTILSAIIMNLFEPYLFLYPTPYAIIPYLCAYFAVLESAKKK